MMKRSAQREMLSYSLRIVLLTALLISSPTLAQENPTDRLPIQPAERLKVFDEVWERVNTHFFDPKFNGVDWARMREQYRPQAEAAQDKRQLIETLQKMLNELRSSHLLMTLSVKLKKQTIEQGLERKVNRQDSLNFDAGLSYTQIDGKWVVSTVAEGSGAQLAGVQRGWAVTRWKGEPVRDDMPFACEFNQQINVQFVDWQGAEKKLSLTCKLYSQPASPSERITRRLETGMVYLRFANFSDGTDSWLANQVAQSQTAAAIVIDLRGNPGGYLAVMEKCLAPFFEAPTVFGEFRARNGKQEQLQVKGQKNNAYRGRVAVLLDEKSASAAEIFASSMQEKGRAIVVGRKSSGDVLGSRSYGLSHGFRVNIPFMDYHTAKGVRLEKHGVLPNETVRLTLKAFLENRDLDLERAVTLLQNP